MRKLKKRIYYALQLSLATPLCISNGEAELTDCDVLRTWDGQPFIPGSSFAGAFRAYCEETGIGTEQLFGSSRETDSRMSGLWISDFYFEGDNATSIRDGVQLKNRIAVDGSKYNVEVLEHGSGVLYIELQLWDDMNQQQAEQALRQITGAIWQGDIRFGTQKNRGLGKLTVEKVYRREFASGQADEWIAFARESLLEEKYEQKINEWRDAVLRYTTLQIPLRLTGMLGIRQYSAKVGQPDMVSLMRRTDSETEKTVIPGSSWKGALRSRITEIALELGADREMLEECRWLFGFVEEKKCKASDMAVPESILEGNGYVCSIRNQVSRFENATVTGALYQERCAVEGETLLEIKVRREAEAADWFLGLVLLAVRDLQKGYLSVGGGAAVGKGIFADNGEIRIKNGKTRDAYYQALHQRLDRVVAK